jgi:hypothetical protein
LAVEPSDETWTETAPLDDTRPLIGMLPRPETALPLIWTRKVTPESHEPRVVVVVTVQLPSNEAA